MVCIYKSLGSPHTEQVITSSIVRYTSPPRSRQSRISALVPVLLLDIELVRALLEVDTGERGERLPMPELPHCGEDEEPGNHDIRRHYSSGS
jgi:hypothetical protein